MTRDLKVRTLALGTLIVAGAACSDMLAPEGESLDTAFASMLLGYQNTVGSFDETATADAGWGPAGRRGRGSRGSGELRGGFMGGGLGDLFRGVGFGPGFGRRPFGAANQVCAFDSAAGRLVCSSVIDHGLTIQRSIGYKDTAGNVQSAFDTLTTNSVNVKVSVTGTRTRGEDLSTTVEHDSERTVTGLAAGSTQRTVNSVSTGKETTTGTNDTGNFTAVRTVSDKVEGVVIPIQPGQHSYPTAGKVTRSMQVVVTYEGQAPTTSSRSELITYDGSDKATVVITRDGVSRTCTVQLPRGRPTCS